LCIEKEVRAVAKDGRCRLNASRRPDGILAKTLIDLKESALDEHGNVAPANW